MKKNLNPLLLIIFSAFTLLSCVTTYNIQSDEEEETIFPQSYYIPDDYKWTTLDCNIKYTYYKADKIKLIYHLVCIDLTQKDLQLVYYPDSSTKLENNKFSPKKTSVFAKENNCIIAINATPFSNYPVNKTELVGIQKDKDTYYSDINSRYSAIGFANNKAYIIKQQNLEECNQYDYVFGGFFTILSEGTEQPIKAHTYDSRTALGISQDGSLLYILSVEGENKTVSQGLSYQMCAKILKRIGCSDALEMDGGSSTELCINGKSVLTPCIKATQANSIGFKKR